MNNFNVPGPVQLTPSETQTATFKDIRVQNVAYNSLRALMILDGSTLEAQFHGAFAAAVPYWKERTDLDSTYAPRVYKYRMSGPLLRLTLCAREREQITEAVDVWHADETAVIHGAIEGYISERIADPDLELKIAAVRFAHRGLI